MHANLIRRSHCAQLVVASTLLASEQQLAALASRFDILHFLIHSIHISLFREADWFWVTTRVLEPSANWMVDAETPSVEEKTHTIVKNKTKQWQHLLSIFTIACPPCTAKVMTFTQEAIHWLSKRCNLNSDIKLDVLPRKRKERKNKK